MNTVSALPYADLEYRLVRCLLASGFGLTRLRSY